jgi:hypothetical protein
MSTTNTTPVSITTTTRDEKALAIAKENLIAAAAGLKTAVVNFTVAIKNAVAAGATTDEIKKWAKEGGLTQQGISKALIAAGVRQRGERSDKGAVKLSRTICGSIDDAFAKWVPTPKKGDKGKDEGDKVTVSTPEVLPAETTTTPSGLAAYVLRLCGGDKGKAMALLMGASAAVASVESAAA